MQELSGKVAVVTGAASGIGLALTERFVAEGMKVVLADVDEPRLAEVTGRLTEDGADVAAIRCDTASESDVAALAEFAITTYGAAHVLCNNAGIGGMGDAWLEPMALWERVVGINLFGVVHGIRTFLPIMTDQGEGHIVNTASMAGLIATPGAAPYNATKHAVVAISEGLFLELQATQSPVGVSVLCPSWVKTRLMEHEPAEFETPIATVMTAVARNAVTNDGIEASDVADQVVDAIRNDRFWILTHPESRTAPLRRMERAAAGENPQMLAV